LRLHGIAARAVHRFCTIETDCFDPNANLAEPRLADRHILDLQDFRTAQRVDANDLRHAYSFSV
jgi:hypothetical protein